MKHDVVNIEIGEDFLKMSEKQLFKFIEKQHKKIRSQATQVCIKQGIPESDKDKVEAHVAASMGFVKYNGYWVGSVMIRHVLSIFKKAIDNNTK